MRKLFLFFLLIPGIASAQKSVLYNEHRQLIVDTSFHIDEHSYKSLPRIEDEILPFIYKNIDVPRMLPPFGDGLVIVKLSFNKEQCDFEIVKAKGAAFGNAVYKAFKLLKNEYGVQRKKTEKYLVYIPVKFEMTPVDYEAPLNKNHAITLKREAYLDKGGFRDTIVIDDGITIPKLSPEKKSN